MGLGGFGQKQLAQIEQIKREATELDQRRQEQIQNQIGSINRLLDDPSATAEIAVLHDKLVGKQEKLRRIKETLDHIYESGQLDNLGDIAKIIEEEEDA